MKLNPEAKECHSKAKRLIENTKTDKDSTKTTNIQLKQTDI